MLLLALTVAPAARPQARRSLDWRGAVLATAGIGLLVFGVVRTEQAGWTAPEVVGALAAAVFLLAGFGVLERRVRDPLLRFGLLRSRWVSGANAFAFLAAAGQFASFYFVSLYLQQVLRLDAASAGAAFLPYCAGAIVGTVLSARLTNRSGPRAVLVPGGLCAAAGLAWLAAISPTGSVVADVLGPSLVTGVGLGTCLGALAVAATTGVGPREAGMASGLLNSSRQLGGCVGLAVLSTVAAARTGGATSPAALTDGFAVGLDLAAALLAAGAAVAYVVLSRRPAPSAAPGGRAR